MISIFANSCSRKIENNSDPVEDNSSLYVMILGTLQDGGSPHAGCKKSCCVDLNIYPDITRKVVSLAIVDKKENKYWIIEASPDFTSQLALMQQIFQEKETKLPVGIFLTHAHLGHYTGLMYLGKEALNTKEVPVYAMPRMTEFLQQNGPWSQLVSQQNITLNRLNNGDTVKLSSRLFVVPFLVPHRDEYSETVGYKIIGPNKTMLFIPDINKWEIWDKQIINEVASVDYALIDATFYDELEIKSRDIRQIPHPFVVETMTLFKTQPETIKSRIYFTHLNHTNPLLDSTSNAYRTVNTAGYHVCKFMSKFKM